jgi:hypothetical protein
MNLHPYQVIEKHTDREPMSPVVDGWAASVIET